MAGLLLKDWYTLTKQMKALLLALLLFACLPGYSLASIAVLYVSMLPVTALSYDERSKWDELALMMPYSPQSIVASKYLLGVIVTLGTAVVAILSQLVIGAFKGTQTPLSTLLSPVIIACLALILLSFSLPLFFRFGVEKGRIAFTLLICGGVVGSMALQDGMTQAISHMQNTLLPMIAVVLATAVLIGISIPLATAMYKKKKGITK